MEKPVRYLIIDRQTGHQVSEAKTRKAASRIVDRLDNKYGASRYTARPVYEESK